MLSIPGNPGKEFREGFDCRALALSRSSISRLLAGGEAGVGEGGPSPRNRGGTAGLSDLELFLQQESSVIFSRFEIYLEKGAFKFSLLENPVNSIGTKF